MPIDQSIILEKNITVRYAETGVNGKLKPVNVLNYFQDIASDHSAEMGVSAMDLLPKGLAWVIFQYQIDIFRYPSWKDNIRMRTWRYPYRNLYELRQYEIFDDHDNLLISSKSSWVLTSISSKKPVRLNKHLPPEMMDGQQQPITDDFVSVPEISRTDSTRSFNARMHDLDFNRHVNNSVYVVWGIETVPQDIIRVCRPTAITVNYLGESLYSDPVTVKTQRLLTSPAINFLHTIINESTGKEITRLQTRWEPFE
jgi:medium-chain acyl-[acyl-carrier-protein] hydrolase